MKLYLIFLLVMSLIAFITYGVDKKKAQMGAYRIKEAVLLGLGFFGGSVGALLGMQIFRHKTKHFYFYIVNFLGLALQIALLLFIL